MLENNPETRLAEVEWVGKLEYLGLCSHSNTVSRRARFSHFFFYLDSRHCTVNELYSHKKFSGKLR